MFRPQFIYRSAGALEFLLRRDRAIIISGLVVLSLVAWAYTGYLALTMESISQMEMAAMHSWELMDIGLLFVMWVVMMIAMMVPSASPMILLFARINRERRIHRRPFVPTGVFLAGYLLAWTGYSLLATLAQWLLHSLALLSPMMVSTSPLLGGTLFLAAGLFQLTPLKDACLKQCRSPLSFLMSEWREGSKGALVMGLKHGSYCVGCCWILMALLFAAGVMNLYWVAGLALFVLLEKALPAGLLAGRAAGVLLILAGLVLILRTGSPW